MNGDQHTGLAEHLDYLGARAETQANRLTDISETLDGMSDSLEALAHSVETIAQRLELLGDVADALALTAPPTRRSRGRG